MITGAGGMVGTALYQRLKSISEGKDKTRPEIKIDKILLCHSNTASDQLKKTCSEADFVFHLAGVNRTENKQEYFSGNVEYTNFLLNELIRLGKNTPVMFSSSIQASLDGRFTGSEYGNSKKAAEELVFNYAEKTGAKVAVYRFPNLMGHSRPNYNSAVSTFCWAIANDRPYTVTDPSTEIELLSVEDLVEGMLDLLENKEIHCEYEDTRRIVRENGKYCCVPKTFKIAVGELAEILETFRQQPGALPMPKIPEDSIVKKLYSLYLTYVPSEKFKHTLKMNIDSRGSFTELMRTEECGQVSINISKPGVTKGQHWHASKWEQFIVVSGHGLIQERNIATGDIVEFEVSGEKLEMVAMIPGWTHSITNLSDTENLVTVMICNEAFRPERPDTFYEEV